MYFWIPASNKDKVIALNIELFVLPSPYITVTIISISELFVFSKHIIF